MTRAEKAELIDFLTKEFQGSQVVICDYKGLRVKDLESLRNSARDSELKVRVVKNKLASIALKSIGAGDLDLKDTNVLIWGADQISVAKVAQKFSDTNDKLVVKYGYMEGQVCDKATVEALSKLPSREELIGMLLSVWNGPIRNFVTGLDNLRTKKEEE